MSRNDLYALASRVDLAFALGVRQSLRRLNAAGRFSRVIDNRRARVAEAMWHAAARAIEAESTSIATGVTRIRRGTRSTLVRGQTTVLSDCVSTDLAGNKIAATAILADAGLSTGRLRVVAACDRKAAEDFRRSIPGPCVVKPARGEGGRGVTGEIRSRGQLDRALFAAGRFDDRVLISEQCQGDSFRVLLLDGTVLDVLRRARPYVVGDGCSTIFDLVLAEHLRRVVTEGVDGLKSFLPDLDSVFTLASQQLSLRSVPRQGQRIAVKTATNFNGQHQIERVRGPLKAALTEPARRAAAVLGVRLAGVDMIASFEDGKVKSPGVVILEVNAVPALTYHYNLVDQREAVDVAARILLALLAPL